MARYKDLIDQRGRLPVLDSIDLVLPVADALGFAHEAGILHKTSSPPTS